MSMNKMHKMQWLTHRRLRRLSIYDRFFSPFYFNLFLFLFVFFKVFPVMCVFVLLVAFVLLSGVLGTTGS